MEAKCGEGWLSYGVSWSAAKLLVTTPQDLKVMAHAHVKRVVVVKRAAAPATFFYRLSGLKDVALVGGAPPLASPFKPGWEFLKH